MNWFISLWLLILFTEAAFSSRVIVYSTNGTWALEAVKERFEKTHKIPKILIQGAQVKKCPEAVKRSNALIVCANGKELEVINSSPLIIESLAVFRNEVE